MPVSCPQCSTPLPAQAAFCTGCGLRMFVGTPDDGVRPQLVDRVQGALSYITFIPAVLFLVLEVFKRNKFVRFHSFQSIYLSVAAVGIGVILRGILAILSLIPRVGYLLGWLVVVVTALGVFMLWLVLIVKALKGERFQVPILGQLAENSSSR